MSAAPREPATHAEHAQMNESIAREAAALVEEASLPFQRGEPLGFLRKMTQLGRALTLPIVPVERARTAILLKVLYSLWNVLVDDEIDRQGTAAELDASMAYLSGRGEASSGASAVLERMARLVPAGRISRLDALGFDLWEVASGLGYELFINRNPGLATPFEYRRYSTVTASMKVDLDIDCLLAASPPRQPVYRMLREAYDELGAAVKLAGDIGTARREVHDEDNMSLLRILAGQADRGAAAEEVLAAALRHRGEVEALARAHLRRAVELFSSVPEMDPGAVVHTVERIVEVYASGVDPFFGEGGR